MALSPAPESILSVSALTRLIKNSLESGFPALWVKGEVSGCKRHESGHLYFSLKEGREAVLECAMWRTHALRLTFEPRDGDQVEAFGGIVVYEPRGRYQLAIKELRPAGLGALLLALEALKKKLQAEGLFDGGRKRPIPTYPRRVGIVTSPVGAAVRDMVKVLRARWPAIEIVLAPTRVQGPGAASEIAAAIDRFGRYARVDVLIVGRGGGSLEDLWAFNEESVVRAIVRSPIPVISAVGHEVDWTLADLAADVRAATPSNAAEIAVRDRTAMAHGIAGFSSRMNLAILGGLERRRRALHTLTEKHGFRRQTDALRLFEQRIDDLTERLGRSLLGLVRSIRDRLRAVHQSYGLREWPRLLRQRHDHVHDLRESILETLVRSIHERRGRVTGFGDRLRALSPRLVLERGYCLVRSPDGNLVRAAESLAVGERVAIEFARGEADARVEAVRKGDGDDA